jgi:NAD(P)-dependent dehydrogenase (short-subunit alcohol dehydrogenase family)
MSSSTNPQTIVLITGANQGLGYECVKKLACEQPNYHIILASRNLERGHKAVEALSLSNVSFAEGTTVEALQLDINDDESIARAAQHVQDKHGRLDVLLNNAAISHAPEATSLRETFLKVIETNAVSAFCVTEAFIHLLKKAEVPRLLFMSSGLGSITYTLDPSWPYYGLDYKPYMTSKTTMNMIAALCTVHHGKDGVKVNVIDPGHRATNLNGFDENASDPSGGALEACRLIVDTDRNGQHGRFSSAENVFYPW